MAHNHGKLVPKAHPNHWLRAELHTQAFADDQVIVLSGASLTAIEEAWPVVWENCLVWAEENKLEYNVAKTQSLFLKGSRVIRSPRIKLNGTTLLDTPTLKYLGVIFDTGLFFIEHVKHVRAKVAGLALRLFRVAGKSWGVSRQVLRTIYLQAVQPILLYGGETWGKRSGDSRVIRHLNAAQRPFLLCITKAYRTTPTSALQVLSGLPPLHLLAKQRYTTYLNNLDMDVETQVPAGERFELHRRGLVQWQNFTDNDQVSFDIFTDGSKINGGVGLAVACYAESKLVATTQEKLNNRATVFQAELKAILTALQLARERGWNGRLRINSDSKAALMAICKFEVCNRTAMEAYTALIARGDILLSWVKAHAGTEGNEEADRLAKAACDLENEPTQMPCSATTLKSEAKGRVLVDWQRNWERRVDGRATFALVKRLSFKGLNLSAAAVQAITGHGSFNQYYHRFSLREVGSVCLCGIEDDTSDHVLWRCSYPERVSARGRFEQFLNIRMISIRDFRLDHETPVEVLDRFNALCKELVFEYP